MGIGNLRVAGQFAQQFPDEAGEFPGDSGHGLVALEAAAPQPVEARVQTVLSPPAHLLGPAIQLRLAHGKFLAHLRRGIVVLRALDQQPAGVRVAAFGDASLLSFVAAGGLRGDEPEIGHELAGMGEAVDVSQLAHRDHRRHDLEALEPHERLHGGPQLPGYEKIPHRLLAPVHALVGRIDGAEVILQDHFHGRVRQHQFAQVAHVRRGPGALGRVAEPVPQ